MDINIPANIREVMTRLENGGFEAYIVGGCVRDAILGVTPKDYDITTNAQPDEVISCMEGMRVIETGLKHGTVTVVSEGENVEVTTYRIDGDYSDHRRPDSVTFSDKLEDDLARRDFTVNAMAYNDKEGFIDIYGGLRDLFNGRIRCVGEPADRFGEDALRIMRALRFASVLGFRIEPATAAAIHDKKYLLKDVSAERISSELTQLVMGAHPCDILIEFDDVICTVIPEFSKCVGFDQRSRYHLYDVWEHTAHSLENSEADKCVRLALLFHDIEKPTCCTFDDEGQGHFPNHEKRSTETAEAIMRRLRFDNDTIRDCCTLIKFHYVTPVDDKRVVKHLISAMGADMFHKLAELMKGDSRAKQSFCLERVNTLEIMEAYARTITENGECCSISGLAVNGNDLEAAGFEGQAIGKALDDLLSMVIDEKIPNEKDALLSAAKEMLS